PTRAVLARNLSGTQWFGAWPLAMAAIGASGVIQRVTGRGFKLGTPLLWGTLALGAATASVLAALVSTADDLIRDIGDGVAEWPEYVAVAVIGLLSTAAVYGWAKLIAGRRPGVTPSTVWDPEFDRRKSLK